MRGKISGMDEGGAKNPGPAGGPAGAAGRRGRVLAIDDEPLVARAISRTLGREHDVVTETSARAALDRIVAGERFDVILCDLVMAQMGGPEFFAELVRTVPEQAKRVVFLSGGAFTAKAKAFLESVTNARLDKPFEPEQLRALVQAMLQR